MVRNKISQASSFLPQLLRPSKGRRSALSRSQPQNSQAQIPKPWARRPNHCTQDFMLCVHPPDLRVQPPRPRSDKVRSVAHDAFRVGRESFSVAGNRLTLALDVGDLRTPRLSALRFGISRLRAGVDRLRAKVAGLRAKLKPLRVVSRPLQVRVGTSPAEVAGWRVGRWPSCPRMPRGISE
jgi:hypothetical protein